jgi:hypothetical protein
MHRRRGVRSLVLAIALLAAACGGRAAVQSGESPTVLEVVNRATLDMTIYVVSDSGARERLGTATSLTTTRLTIPRRMVASALDIRFAADPVGSSRTHFSESVAIVPGDVVVLEIPPA